MPAAEQLVSGEFRRSLDDRFRLTIPPDLLVPLLGDSTECMLAKEMPGAISLWQTATWEENVAQGVHLIQQKIAAGRLAGRIEQVQTLGRLLSTRHRSIPLNHRGRILVPEGFREFLGVEPGGAVMVIGAVLCIEIWRPEAWLGYLNDQIPRFRELYDELSA